MKLCKCCMLYTFNTLHRQYIDVKIHAGYCDGEAAQNVSGALLPPQEEHNAVEARDRGFATNKALSANYRPCAAACILHTVICQFVLCLDYLVSICMCVHVRIR